MDGQPNPVKIDARDQHQNHDASDGTERIARIKTRADGIKHIMTDLLPQTSSSSQEFL